MIKKRRSCVTVAAASLQDLNQHTGRAAAQRENAFVTDMNINYRYQDQNTSCRH